DADNALPETQEGNNTALRVIQIGGDLVVSALTVPTLGSPGGTILVSDTTTNQGAGGVPASVTKFYLSANTLFDASGTPLSLSRTVPELAAGASSSGSTNVSIPATTAPGAYYLLAVADGDNQVTETSESNNSTARAISIGPDLVVSSLTAPTSAV